MRHRSQDCAHRRGGQASARRVGLRRDRLLGYYRNRTTVARSRLFRLQCRSHDRSIARHDGRDSRPFCEALAANGVLVAPGDCFGMPAHMRMGFALLKREKYAEGLAIFERVLREQ